VRGRYVEALALLADAEQRFDGTARDLVTAHWIGLQGFLGAADVVLERSSAIGPDAERAPRLESLRGTAQAHVARGAFDLAIETLDLHDEAAKGMALGAAQAGFEVALASRIAAHTAAGNIHLATDLVRKHLPVGRRTMLAWLPMAAARTEMMAGRPHVARELISTPLAAVRSQSLIHAEPQMIGILAQTSVRTVSVDQAVREADECWQALDPLVGQFSWSLLLSVADVAARTAPRPGLTERLVSEADDARDAGAFLFEAEMLMAAARVGIAEEVAERLLGVVGQVDGELWKVRGRHAAALAERDEAALREVEARYRTMGYHGYAEGVASALAKPIR
jgi:hypothetical protein